MPVESPDSIHIIDFFRALTETAKKSTTEAVIEIFSTKAHLIVSNTYDPDELSEVLVSFASILIERSDEDTSDTIKQVNTIAKAHQIPVEIWYMESENMRLKAELIDSWVFDILEDFSTGEIAYIDIDDSSIIKYLVYLQYNIIDIPSLYRYLRTCINISQADIWWDEASLIEKYITTSAMDVPDGVLSEVFNAYEYLDRNWHLAQEYYRDCKKTGMSEEEALIEVEVFLTEYAWIHNTMLNIYEIIILPRITQKKIEWDLENLYGKDLFRVYEMINDWLDILDPERYIPERFPTGNLYHLALYENINWDHIRIIH